MVVNKMDLVGFKEEVFRPIQDDLHALLAELEVECGKLAEFESGGLKPCCGESQWG